MDELAISDLKARAAIAAAERGEIDSVMVLALADAADTIPMLNHVEPATAAAIMSYLRLAAEDFGGSRKQRESALMGLVVGFNLGYALAKAEGRE